MNIGKKEIISCIIKSKRLHDEEKNFYVLGCMDGSKNKVTIKGYGYNLKQNDTILATGHWDINETTKKPYFFADLIEIKIPTQKELITEFLSSGIISSISPKLAVEIVSHFGEKTFDIFDNYPERLLIIKGLGKNKLAKILKSWDEAGHSEQLIMAIVNLGFTNIEAIKIYEKFKNNSITQIKSYPYSIHNLVKYICFERVDEVALSMGVEFDSDLRIDATIEYFLKELHYSRFETLILKNQLLYDVKKYFKFKINNKKIIERIESLKAENKVFEIKQNNEEYYQYEIFKNIEEYIANRLLLIQKDNFGKMKDNEIILKDFKFPYNEQQKDAITNSLKEKISIITGGPGVGKTTVLNEVIAQLKNLNLNIQLAAPTGKAAKKMSESTGMEACTIHRLLEYSPFEFNFLRNQENPIICDVIVIDEFSMVDMFLFYYLLKAILNNTKVIIIGDEDQLASVGCGCVLRDLIKSNIFCITRILKTQRQKEGSFIIKQAKRINQGEKFIYETDNRNDEVDFYYLKSENDDLTLKKLDLLLKRLEEKGVNLKNEVQIISPIHETTIGTININKYMQNKLNSGESIDDDLIDDENQIEDNGCNFIEKNGVVFKRGDKIIQIKNNYKKGVYNGDTGKILMVRQDYGLRILFDNGDTIDYKIKELNQISLSYCLSVHKSQGSEYKYLIFLLPELFTSILDRSLLYTGITRGKNMVFLIGKEENINESIKLVNSRNRRTNLENIIVNKFTENYGILTEKTAIEFTDNDLDALFVDDIFN